MNQQSYSQDSILQVFFNDKPEVPESGKDSSFQNQDPDLNFKEYIVGNSTIKSHYVFGKNATLQKSSCFMEHEQAIYAVPAQPVVTFHIQVSGNNKMKFVNGQDGRLINELQYCLLWQNDRILSYELSLYEADYCSLHFRPSHFLEMSHRIPLLTELAMEVTRSSHSALDFYVGKADESLLAFIDAILLEVRHYHISDQRFTHLCECLLIKSMELPVEVQPFPIDALKRTSNSAFSDLDDDTFMDEQKLRFESIFRYYSRDALIANFYTIKQEYLALKEERAKSNAIMKEVKDCYHGVMGDSADLLAESYFWVAVKMEEQMKRFNLTEKEKGTLVEAIITVCDQSFELKTPRADQLQFYTHYTGQTYVGDVGMQEFGEILNMFIPNMNLPTDKLDGSRESRAILDQYIQDSCSFTPLSHITEKGEMDKPPKVVELYHMLMQRMADELTITDTGDFQKSDLIRILDHAYQRNDLSLLLMVEIEQLTDDGDYVENQKFNKICLWHSVLEEAIDEWYDTCFSKEEELISNLMPLYFQSPDKIKAVERKVMETKAIYDAMVPVLVDVGFTMESLLKKNIFLLTAESLIVAAENPYKEK
ncbi:hypothetical protein [Sphingobacterium kitahiroshimense]|uniref:hypothetical protein n=1 Tax=Sphingobacterium kitahiroshimense TaxID=470446 RepID=UPI003208BA80